MNLSTMTREKIAAALSKGGRYMNHAREWVSVKVGEHVNPDDVALALVSPDALVVRQAVRVVSKAKRGAKRAAAAVARKVRSNPTGTGAAAVGERGGWSIVKPEKRDDAGGVLAWGPSGMLEDSEGRLYPFRWALVPLSRIIPSNDPKTGRPLRFYLPELQGRNREAIASRSQVQKLAAGLEARRLMLASSTPADSAPVVWRGTGERSEAFLVVSGNGRTMAALLAFETESEAWEQYLSAVASRWNMASKLDDLDRDERFLAVRVLGGKDGAPLAQAVALAGASQGTASAGLSDLEKAVHVGRALGIETPLALGRFQFVRPVTPETVGDWIGDNPETWRRILAKMDPAKAAAINSQPAQAAALVEAVMLQGIPSDVVAAAYDPSGRPDLVPVLLGMLPAVWSLESAASQRPPEIAEGWRLLPRLPRAFEWFRRMDGKSVAKMRAALRDEEVQGGLDLGDLPKDTAPLSDSLAWALGVAIVKAAGRAAPADAMAEYLREYVADALRTGPGESLFGADDVNPGAVLLGHVDRRLLRKNPPPGRVRHRKTGTVVSYPGGVEVHFRRRVEDPEALAMADSHYLEALEGQGSLFGGLGRESTLRRNPDLKWSAATVMGKDWQTAPPGEGPGPWPWLRLSPKQWEDLRHDAERQGVSAVALGPAGFWSAWKAAGFDPAKLSPAWIRKRDGFAARHLAQFQKRQTLRRDLALRVWAIHPAAALHTLAKLGSEKGLR